MPGISIDGVETIITPEYQLYYIKAITDELKQEIRNRLVRICHGPVGEDSPLLMHSYHATLKEFFSRYDTIGDTGEAQNRKKGMIGELLVHVILEIESKFSVVSPFFNMEERSFKKGFDICLYDADSQNIWITEVKSGEKQAKQKTSSAAAVALLNTAKNDLKTRLNNENISLWMNAVNGARQVITDSDEKEAVIKILGKYADDAYKNGSISGDKNVILSGVLFNDLNDKVAEQKVAQKYTRTVNEQLFNKLSLIVIQEETYTEVVEFLQKEARNGEKADD